MLDLKGEVVFPDKYAELVTIASHKIIAVSKRVDTQYLRPSERYSRV
jgi:hypothetical protein